MRTHTGSMCFCVFVAMLMKITASTLATAESLKDPGSNTIPAIHITSKNNRYLKYDEKQLMTFDCNMTGGDERKANLVLSFGGEEKKSFGLRSVSLTKIAEEGDNYSQVECSMSYKGVRDPFYESRLVTIFFSPRAEGLSNGTLVATGDFVVGQGANLTVRVRANPKLNSVMWQTNGMDLDRERFQPWTSDTLKNESWEIGLGISEVYQDDFQAPFQVAIQNDYGDANFTVIILLQRTNNDDTDGWSFKDGMKILVLVIVISVALIFCCLKLRGRFEEKCSNANDEAQNL